MNTKLGRSHHGHSKTPTYRSWSSMLARCYNQRNTEYKRYGARGISVCASWRNSFLDFLADLGEKPSGCQLDRKNNNGNYEVGNCHWVTPKQNSRNRRTSRMISACGAMRSMAEWAELIGVKQDFLRYRLKIGTGIKLIADAMEQERQKRSWK